ncbi:hypothetical protein [Almyronema epifaneia]|uniref:Glycosyltransferase RgtA/B/C/D-like domain-containing protein n=1 Tax=Almyronema epifaneia S1 TaxID=2991925 RepID=A0ABW6IJW4_9CYAN
MDRNISQPNQPTQFWRVLANSPHRAIALVFGLSFLVTASMGSLHWPVPLIHNEFAHLLTADTIASGRFANPTHPLFAFFESIHILQQPSYAAKLPPGAGLFLGLGQRLGGDPVWGIWLTTAIATSAVYWALWGYFKSPWALGGTGLIFLDIGILHHWSQSYRGAMVAVLAGALMWGGLIRLIRRPKAVNAILLAIGLGLLANTRPLEGLFFALPTAVVLAGWLLQAPNRPMLKRRWQRGGLPLLVALVLVSSLTMAYNKAVTGNPLKFPYSVYEQQYTVVPAFLWQDYRPVPDFPNQQLQKYSDWQAERFERMRQKPLWRILTLRTEDLLFDAANAWFWIFLLIIPLVYSAWIRQPWLQLAFISLLLLLSTRYLILPNRPDQLAPGTIAIALLMTACVQKLVQAAAQRSKQKSRWPSWQQVLLIAFLLYLLLKLPYKYANPGFINGGVSETPRARLVEVLTALPGKDVVIVRFNPQTSYKEAWVYNPADIDSATIIFANDLGDEANRQLLDYYLERQFWLQTFDAQGQPLPIQPYLSASD